MPAESFGRWIIENETDTKRFCLFIQKCRSYIVFCHQRLYSLSRLGKVLTFILISISISFGQWAGAQQNVDSLQQVVTNSEGLERGNALLALGKVMSRNLRADEALKYLDSAAIIFRDLNENLLNATAQAERTILLERLSLNYNTVRSFEKMDTLVDLLKNDSLYNQVKTSAARSYAALGRPEMGIGMLYEVLGRYRESQDTLGQIDMIELLTYGNFGDENQVDNIPLFDSVISLASAYDSMPPGWFSTIYNNYASELLSLGQFDRAKEMMEKADEQAKLSPENGTFLFNFFTNAEIALATGDLESCQNYFGICSDLENSDDGISDRMVVYEARSHFYLLEGEREVSDRWFDESRKLAYDSGDFGQVLEMLQLRSRLLKAKNQYKDALMFYEEWNSLQDSVYNSIQRAKFSELRVVKEMELAESENQLLREQNENILLNKKRNTWLFVAILTFILFVGGIMLFFLARTRRLNNSISSQNEKLANQNEKLVELTEDNELLMGIVAHDLKAPLTKVESLISLLIPAEDLDEEKKVLLDMTLGVIAGGKNLVKDILILSEAGREMTPDLHPTNLGDLIQTVSRDFHEIATRKEIDIQLVFPDEKVMPVLHPPYLIRVLDNLISNAIKFSPRGSKIVLSWDEDGSGSWCKVTDFGPGIPPEEQDKIFQRFARLSNRPTDGESSTGLGLFIVKTLLDTMNATVSLDSQRGKGSTFTVSFPSTSTGE